MKQNWHYDQGDHKHKWDGAHKNGVCLALAAHWIIETASGRDFRAWAQSGQALQDSRSLYDQDRTLRREDEQREVAANVFDRRRRAGQFVPFMGTHRATAHPGYLPRGLELIKQRVTGPSPLRGGSQVTLKNQSPTNVASLVLLSEG